MFHPGCQNETEFFTRWRDFFFSFFFTLFSPLFSRIPQIKSSFLFSAGHKTGQLKCSWLVLNWPPASCPFVSSPEFSSYHLRPKLHRGRMLFPSTPDNWSAFPFFGWGFGQDKTKKKKSASCLIKSCCWKRAAEAAAAIEGDEEKPKGLD